VSAGEWVPRHVDVQRANPARVYDYLLGGNRNFAVDREFARRAVEAMPWVRDLARHNRRFLGRAVRYCAADGARQFLDLGSGMPTGLGVHELARRQDPTSRVVYVDREPVAVAHCEVVLAGVPHAGVVEADLADPDHVLGHPTTRRLLDLDRPVAVVLASSLHFVLDADRAAATVAAYLDAVPPGSHLVLSHLADDGDTGREVSDLVELSKTTSSAGVARSREWIAGLFDGLEVVEPGLVYTSQWRPEEGISLVTGPPSHASLLAAVGRKP